ncbi:MAG: molybdopterin-dependent oxidoreductase, partial [Acidobacteria bacterium]|nr:molybdopterin-dependent oxidoreductase [Acidobacteriota bacterium]
ATHIADVEVDLETGKVKVLKLVAVHDAGRLINPDGAEWEWPTVLGDSEVMVDGTNCCRAG